MKMEFNRFFKSQGNSGSNWQHNKTSQLKKSNVTFTFRGFSGVPDLELAENCVFLEFIDEKLI